MSHFNKSFFFCTLLFASLLPYLARAEAIHSFDAQITVNRDSSLTIDESIVYDFGSEQRHGIFRTIPIKYNNTFGNYNLRVSNISVRDEISSPYKFRTSKEGDDISIKIGDPETFVSGKHTYVISYTVRRAINFFSDHDELYWNITGLEWPVSIERSSLIVTLPDGRMDALRAECFSGIYGSQTSCASKKIEKNVITFLNGPLVLGGGLTAVIRMPKGLIIQPTLLQKWSDMTRDNLILFLPIIAFGVLFYLWRTRGRDPKGRTTIIAQYESPDNLTPVEIATITDFDVQTSDLSAIIIDLAVRGYLRITQTKTPGIFGVGGKTDYIFDKLKDPDDSLRVFEKTMMDTIFVGSKTAILSTLNSQFAAFTEQIQKEIYASLTTNGYFPESPKKIRTYYAIIGGVVLFLGMALTSFGIIFVASLIFTALIIIAFGLIMPVRTVKGVCANENILGFKEYLSIAEQDRIKFHNAPEKNPRRFEKLLPYAMVLGVEKEWAKQFEGIYNQQPNWYSNADGSFFQAHLLTSSLRSFSTSANSTISFKPSRASSGGSGFSGGGSGGGFGGSGGGSW